MNETVEKMKYREQCAFYLGIEIIKSLMLEETHCYIDAYYEKVKEIAEDFINNDNANLSLLDSIHEYIDANESKILEKIKVAFHGFI